MGGARETDPSKPRATRPPEGGTRGAEVRPGRCTEGNQAKESLWGGTGDRPARNRPGRGILDGANEPNHRVREGGLQDLRPERSDPGDLREAASGDRPGQDD